MEKELIIKQVDEMMDKVEYAEDRVHLSEKILKICEENDWIDMTTMQSKSFLNKLANYILYSPTREEKEDDSVKEKLIMDYNEFRKIMKHEEPTDNVLYILFKEKNYRAPIKQKITFQDLKDYDELREMQEYIMFLRNADIERQFAVRHMSLVKEDQKILKDSLKGTFYFKRVEPVSTNYDLDLVEMDNPNNIRKMLPLLREGQYNLQEDLDCMLFDLDQAVNNLKLTPKQHEMLKRFIEGDSVRDIAYDLGHYFNFVDRGIQTICKKIALMFGN